MLCATKFSPLTLGQVESIWTHSGRAAVLAAICICVEQTFTESSAHESAFSSAFSTALDAYLGSALQGDVNRGIARFTLQDYKEVLDPHGGSSTKKIVPKLVEVIKTHRLRIHPKKSEEAS